MPVLNAISDAVATCEAYSRTAGEFAALGDVKGLVYAVRCASAAILSAADLAGELRPSRQNGGQQA
ncbi:hypothetical protein FV226_23395 [Methylobacterium sp. WL12]|nr:hypothetical protein FV226_23395 [Methylobacterium sp. WL12]